MAKLDDVELFVEVVKAGGLAAAGRQVGLSPAAMTARINSLEARYETRLLHRSTRSIGLTPSGERFYQSCLRIVEELHIAEAVLKDEAAELSGRLAVTAPSDFGRQFIAEALAKFVRQYPKVQVSLHLDDGIMNLAQRGFDLGIRIGNLPDSSLIARPLVSNRRLLCASPEYLQHRGKPKHPADLETHDCIVMAPSGEVRNVWFFVIEGQETAMHITPVMTGNDGALVRQWALQGMGIVLKSYWDVCKDISTGRLIPLLEDFTAGLSQQDDESVGLQIVYPQRRYMPRQVQAFSDFLTDFMCEQ
ncbi:LysR family transcriptional regulator [Aliamphritea ceti]|uniref:LysR family transcriptional regulator n=1 Tax=Aliamphritea ceti TaxID=1524258 RepID=UPI0021C418ED|nr:LysR family transcriptional regulator [Aliamphritea ceti]